MCGLKDLAQNNIAISNFDATGLPGGASRLLLHTTRLHAFRPPLLSDGYAVAEERRARWRRNPGSSSERNDPPGKPVALNREVISPQILSGLTPPVSSYFGRSAFS